MGAVLQEMVRGVERTTSVARFHCFWRWANVQRCSFTDLDVVHANCPVDRCVAESFLYEEEVIIFFIVHLSSDLVDTSFVLLLLAEKCGKMRV